jgi:hypothetical protein
MWLRVCLNSKPRLAQSKSAVPGARWVVFVSPAAVGAAERCDGGLLLLVMGRRVVVEEEV